MTARRLSSTILVFFLVIVAFALLATSNVQGINVYSPLSPSLASTTSTQPTSSNKYWFQVGARMQGGVDATGVSVQIQVRSPQKPLDSSTLSYWVGIDLPHDSFIQVGYTIEQDVVPQWFWEYFPPGSAKEGTGIFHGEVGDKIGPNGTWYTFALTSQSTLWTASVNGQTVGSVDMGVSNSGGNTPYAVAEVAGTVRGDNVLGPVEFRNLEYRDTSNQWHAVDRAVSYCCYGAGSSTFPGLYPYGLESFQGQNNVWIAGSNLPLPIQSDDVPLWPWYRLTISLRYSNISEWHVYGDRIDLSELSSTIPVPISGTSRYVLGGWYVNGKFANQLVFTVTADMDLKPAYVTQYLVQVNSPMGRTTGSGWYNQGSNVTISVSPTTIRMTGLLGKLGLGSTMSGWSGDFDGAATGGISVVQVHSPMKITAVWRTNYGTLPYYVLIIAGAITVVLTVISFRRSSRKR